MSNGANDPSKADTGYFTDADDLQTDVPKAVDDPDRAPRMDSVGGAPAAAALTEAPPERDAQVAAVRAALGSNTAAVEALDRLSQSSRLDDDADLAPNLLAFARAPRAPALMLAGIDAGLILATLVRHLDDPLRVTQGRGRGTCGAATLEYLMLRSKPAELTRLVDGITGIAEKATMRSGASLVLPPTAIARDDSERVDLDRLLQSALMNRAATMSWLFDYDNTKDHSNFWSEIQGNSRIPISGLCSLWDDLTGTPHTSVTTLSETTTSIAARLAAAVADGTPVPALVGFGSPSALHWLTVEKMDAAPTSQNKRWVYLRNPWGRDDGDGPPERYPLPEGGGRIVIEHGEFVGMLHGAVLPG